MMASFVLPASIGAAGAPGRRAIVVGGSIAGLFVALLLRRAGWTVEINERVGSELSGRGAGIVTHAQLFDVLRSAGIEVQSADIGVRVPGRRVFDLTGRILGELSLEQILTSWGRLYGVLREALPAGIYRHGKNLLRVEEVDDVVTAHFDDGTRSTGELLVGSRRPLFDRSRPV